MEQFCDVETKSERWMKNSSMRIPRLSWNNDVQERIRRRKNMEELLSVRKTGAGGGAVAGKRRWEIHKLGRLFVARMKIFLARAENISRWDENIRLNIFLAHAENICIIFIFVEN